MTPLFQAPPSPRPAAAPFRAAAARLALLGLALAFFPGCAKRGPGVFPPYDGSAERDAFWDSYNRRVADGLRAEEARLAAELAEAAEGSPEAAGLAGELDRARARLERPEFFTFAAPEDLPAGLQWEDGLGQPEVGDAAATKGGTFTDAITSFPPTIRTLGANSNNSFRGIHYDDIELGPVSSHPDTGEIIPGVAESWAVSADGHTVYFKIDPEAAYSDGVPVQSDDFFMTFYIQLSEYPQNPFGNQWYSTQYTNITRYDELTFSITLAEAKPLAPYFASIAPSPRHFYREFGPDFVERYQWRPRPTTGAYEILPEDLAFGRSITLSRVEDWWARDRQYYRHRFNPDRLVYRVVRTPEKMFELFRKGSLDAFLLTLPEHWYEKTEIPEVHHGYIHKARFHNLWPRSAMGLYLNTARPPLDNLDVRVGIAHATYYQKVIDFDLRGDFKRLNSHSEGYPLLGDPPLRAREFSPAKAREAFARGGFTTPGPDGILRNAAGDRLSLTITFRKTPTTEKYMQRLKEEALRCGLEFQLEAMDGTAFFQKASLKQHQIAQVAWGTTPPFPDHFQHFHSRDAYLEDGKTPRPNTNNLTSFADPRMDALCEAQRSATTVEQYREATFAADQIVHDTAIWVPGFDSDYYRLGFWRWVRWPEGTFNAAISSDPFQHHVLWIDEAIRAETLAAQRAGETFPEQELVFDQHRADAIRANPDPPQAREQQP